MEHCGASAGSQQSTALRHKQTNTYDSGENGRKAKAISLNDWVIGWRCLKLGEDIGREPFDNRNQLIGFDGTLFLRRRCDGQCCDQVDCDILCLPSILTSSGVLLQQSGNVRCTHVGDHFLKVFAQALDQFARGMSARVLVGACRGWSPTTKAQHA
jgi:hypothetical protein